MGTLNSGGNQVQVDYYTRTLTDTDVTAAAGTVLISAIIPAKSALLTFDLFIDNTVDTGGTFTHDINFYPFASRLANVNDLGSAINIETDNDYFRTEAMYSFIRNADADALSAHISRAPAFSTTGGVLQVDINTAATTPVSGRILTLSVEYVRVGMGYGT